MNATVFWDAVTRNNDGTPITDLSGYDVYQGTAHGVYTSHVTVSAPGTSTSYAGLNDNITYYWAVIAFDSVGNQSPISAEVSKGPAPILWGRGGKVGWR